MDVTLLAQQRVGKVLRGKWHLDRLIDVGGMAAVFEATHRNGSRAAIKMLHPKYVSDVQARTRFLREGYAANRVGHPCAVAVIDDDFTEEGDVYLVMELLDGESLEARIARDKVMDPLDVLGIADQLLDALACAHAKDIIHRDIKPANVMLTRSGIVKLLDFGLARVRELPAIAGVHSAEIVFGTVAYCSPEAARANNEEMDGRADVWAVAATMFRALAGRTVHGMDGSVVERLIRAAKNQAPPLAHFAPSLNPRICEVIDRGLMFDPDDRWPSAAVMQAVVQDVMSELMEETGAPPSLYYQPALAQMGRALTSTTGPQMPLSGHTTPTPRPTPFRTATAPTPSPSPYPYPSATPPRANPLNQVPPGAAPPGAARAASQPFNPLNQVQPAAAPPRAAPQPASPLNQVHARSQVQAPAPAPASPQSRVQPAPARPAASPAPKPSTPASSASWSALDVTFEDDEIGGSAFDLTITIDDELDEPAPPAARAPRRDTIRDLGAELADRAKTSPRTSASMVTLRTTPVPAAIAAEDDVDVDVDLGSSAQMSVADVHAAPPKPEPKPAPIPAQPPQLQPPLVAPQLQPPLVAPQLQPPQLQPRSSAVPELSNKTSSPPDRTMRVALRPPPTALPDLKIGGRPDPIEEVSQSALIAVPEAARGPRVPAPPKAPAPPAPPADLRRADPKKTMRIERSSLKLPGLTGQPPPKPKPGGGKP